MTPELLAEIEDDIAHGWASDVPDIKSLVAEVRRLWAERDARMIVGGPVGEERLAQIRGWNAEAVAQWPRDVAASTSTHESRVYDLLKHVAFLEQIINDANLRVVVGGPLGEERLAELRQADLDARVKRAGNMTAADVRLNDALRHIAFLEQLLLDGDDLLAVRATGYRDGWRAGLERAVDVIEARYLPVDLAQHLRKLAEEGLP